MLWWIIIALIIVIVGTFFLYYNRFVRLVNQIENSLAQIDVQLRKRGDLIPNLVKSVKGYMKHESKIITKVTDARKALLAADKKGDMKGKLKAGNEMQTALKSIFAIAENYPDLKANQNFLHLQQEMSSIEDKIAYSRQYYNDGIMSYNTSTTTIPGVWFASMYGFAKRDYLQIPQESKAVPKLDF